MVSLFVGQLCIFLHVSLLFLVGLRVVNIPFGRLIECCTYDVNPRIVFLHITPASVAAVRGANFATAKFRDAYGSPLEAIVRQFFKIIRYVTQRGFPQIIAVTNPASRISISINFNNLDTS